MKMNEVTLLGKSVKDFFTKDILKIALYPFIITLALMYVLFFVFATDLINAVEDTITQSKQIDSKEQSSEAVAQSETGSVILDFLLNNVVTSWLLGFLFYTAGTLFATIFSLFIALVVIGFLTPKILSIIRKRHYRELEFKGFGTTYLNIRTLLKNTVIMLSLFLILIPFYFIPGINLIALNLPFFYFFHKMLNYDIASTLLSENEFGKIRDSFKNELRLKSVGLYVLSMIPFLALFSTVFFVVYLGHTYMDKVSRESYR